MINGVHFVRKRLSTGELRWYVYAWRGGPQIMSSDGKTKPKLDREALKAAAAALETRVDNVRTVDPTLFLSLIRSWRSEDSARPSSLEWERLGVNTKATWGLYLNKIEKRWGKVPLEVFDNTRMIGKVVAWRDGLAHTPRAADIGVTVLRALLKFGMHRGVLTRNVAAGVCNLYVNGQRAEIIWTEADLAAFIEVAGERDARVADAVLLASATGLRRADLVESIWSDVGEFAVRKRAMKVSLGRRRYANVPRIPQLNDVLARLKVVPRAQGTENLLVTSKGVPWSPNYLSKEVLRLARKAGIEHVDEDAGTKKMKHLHDLRGTFATRLMIGPQLTNQEIAGIMAWSPEQVDRIRRIYVDDTAVNVAIGRRIAANCKPKL